MSAGHPRRAALPNLVVIGAQKCGTSALHYYLDLHPEVAMSSPKELSFFLSDDWEPQAFAPTPRERRLIEGPRNWSRGLAWYERHFDPDAEVRGEATPTYASPWHPRVAERMASVIPEAKLIFLARDPIERIVSHYLHLRTDGREWRPLSRAVAESEPIYLGRSRYASILQPFLERFGPERILLLRQEDLLWRRAETLRRVFAFAGVEPDVWDPRMERERNVSGRQGRRFRALARLRESRVARPLYRLPQELKWRIERLSGGSGEARPQLDAGLRERLIDALEPELSALEALTDWDLASWRQRAPAVPGASAAP